ncbi:MAG: hypothetical protein LC660_03660 [Desulfobacteraceae bacterium]|nr:hypothetical protein [Desulfobacteraceae bacterium]
MQSGIERVNGSNLETLDACVQDGYDIACSCPTCGYFSSIDPLQRIDLSLNVQDLGE